MKRAPVGYRKGRAHLVVTYDSKRWIVLGANAKSVTVLLEGSRANSLGAIRTFPRAYVEEQLGDYGRRKRKPRRVTTMRAGAAGKTAEP